MLVMHVPPDSILTEEEPNHVGKRLKESAYVLGTARVLEESRDADICNSRDGKAWQVSIVLREKGCF